MHGTLTREPPFTLALSPSLSLQAIPFSRTKKKVIQCDAGPLQVMIGKVGVVVASGGTNLLGSIVASELWLPVIITLQTVAPNHNFDRDMVEDMRT